MPQRGRRQPARCERRTAHAAPTGWPRGTGRSLLTVASFRIWRSSQGYPARDPIINAAWTIRRPLDLPERAGGEAGIRTRGGVSPTHALQACSFNHSDTSPHTRGQWIFAWPWQPARAGWCLPPPWQFRLVPRLVARRLKGRGGEGGIRTHVGVAPQPAFEAGPLRPLRYLSGNTSMKN